jgi:hypothetical protein
MKKIQTKSKSSNVGKTIGVVAGVAALSAASYVLFGPNAKKNKKAIKGWAIKMKGEIIEKFEDAKVLSEPVYNQIIDQVSKKYSKAKKIDEVELKATVSELKKHWKKMTK